MDNPAEAIDENLRALLQLRTRYGPAISAVALDVDACDDCGDHGYRYGWYDLRLCLRDLERRAQVALDLEAALERSKRST